LSREVTILQGTASSLALDVFFSGSQWQVRRIADPDQLEAALIEHRCHVGIAVFDDALSLSPCSFAQFVAKFPMEWIAIMPPHGAHDPAVAGALADTFFDYLTLPIERVTLLFCTGHAHGKAVLRRIEHPPIVPVESRYGMIGTSPVMMGLYAKLDKIMRAHAPVLITGESGVGKELVALAVHRGSPRNSAPFIPVNCGAIPDTLIGSLLFGHEKGAFTSAYDRQIGSIEAANGGTIFLDEIGDLPMSGQASLLRFLQESTVVRIGSTRTLNIDVRIIAATHVNLESAVRDGRFREDLFYRLNVLHVEVPPLRERDADVLLLAQHYFDVNRASMAPTVRGFSHDALKAMRRHFWPGNIRELFNRLQRAMVLCDGPLITAADLLLYGRDGIAANLSSIATARSGMERGIVDAALIRNGHNVAATARELGISRVTLYRLLRRLGITRSALRTADRT
jgi:DNA-binding NtrC family response regulator